jgi:hypothetical protein
MYHLVYFLHNVNEMVDKCEPTLFGYQFAAMATTSASQWNPNVESVPKYLHELEFLDAWDLGLSSSCFSWPGGKLI